MEQVVVTNHMMGICHMQVCAAKDATDEEILAVCNKENPSGTTNGWTTVVRDDDYSFAAAVFPESSAKWGPVQCASDSERLHFIVAC